MDQSSIENLENKKENETHRFEILGGDKAGRLDKVLSELCDDLSRARLQALIADGQVSVNDEVCEQASYKVKEGDEIEVIIPPPVEALPQPENIPLDIVFEDEHLIVINKQVGLVVHPGAGNYEGTLVNALLYHCGDTLSGIGGVMRPGIVHRLDKDTSGLMVVAKTDAAHQGLAAQLQDRSLSRVYKALVLGTLQPPMGAVDQPIGRDHRNRLKMTVNRKYGKEAKTFYGMKENYRGALSLVECALESGRTHQIRVHMSFLGHPLIGDPLYAAQPTAVRAALKKAGYEPETIESVMEFPRQALHAQRIKFIHPVTQEPHSYESALPDDLIKLLNLLK